MNTIRTIGMSWALAALCALPAGCAVDTGTKEDSDLRLDAIPPGHCAQAEAKDVLIAELMKDSWIAGYPLTRLYVDASGMITGPALPAPIAGDLDVINTIPVARDSVARALQKVSGLPDYVTDGMGPDSEACFGIPAWTPGGPTTVDTTSNEVFAGAVNYASWRTTHKEFGKECPLIKRQGNRDIIDPPGDGSTNQPPSATVSSTGVTANAFGLCPTGTSAGTYCKLSYATGVNYTGRTCQTYYGSLRCLLY
jgi:hypothetical protein